MIISFRDAIPNQYTQMITPYINGMILNTIATSKQSKGLIEQADYIKSKIPGQKKPVVVDIPVETLKNYAGEYDVSGNEYKITVKDGKSLFLNVPGQPEMELLPTSGTNFGIKYMDGYSLEFTSNDKSEVTGFKLTSPEGNTTATKKK